MRYFLASAVLAALAAVPAAGSGGMSTNGMTFNEVVRSYGDTMLPVGRSAESADARVARQLSELENLCGRTDWVSVRRCNQAWRAIHRAHARLERERANGAAE